MELDKLGRFVAGSALSDEHSVVPWVSRQVVACQTEDGPDGSLFGAFINLAKQGYCIQFVCLCVYVCVCLCVCVSVCPR